MIGSKTTSAINAYHHQSWEIPKGQSKMDNPEKTGSMGYTWGRKTKQKHKTINVPLYVSKHE